MNWKLAGQLVFAPVAGAVFAVFLPFIGFALVFWYSGKAMLKRVFR